MKLKTVLVILCLLTAVAVLSACASAVTLSVPDAVIDGDAVIWSPVTGAVGYSVRIDGRETAVTSDCYYDISFSDYNEHTFAVQAIGDGKNYKDGEFGAVLTYKKVKPVTTEALATPVIVDISGHGVVSWLCADHNLTAGYRIYVNNVRAYSVEADGEGTFPPTTFTLPLTEVGSYNIQIQAVAADEKHSDSLKSVIKVFAIDENGVVLSSLNRPSITYNPLTGRIEWLSVAHAVGYLVNVNGTDGVLFSPSESGQISYTLSLTVGVNEVKVKAVADGIEFKDSAYGNSLHFPLETTSAPTGLAITARQTEGAAVTFISWNEAVYCDGYEAEVNGKVYALGKNNYYPVSDLADGSYVIRVRSTGNGTYYTTSPYSAQLGFSIKDGKPYFGALKAPQGVKYDNVITTEVGRENGQDVYTYTANGYIRWEEVEGADSYQVTVLSAGNRLEKTTSVVDVNEYPLTVNGGKPLIVSVRAFCSGSEYAQSGESVEIFCAAAKEKYIYSVNGLLWSVGGFSWDSAGDGISYEVVLDGNILTMGSNAYITALTAGTHTFKVRGISATQGVYSAPFCEELIVDIPSKLQAPSLALNGKVLSWNAIDNASAYRVYCNREVILDSTTSIDLDLDTLITSDGDYALAVCALGSGQFGDSMLSVEILYRKTDAAVGTKDKPVFIGSIADLYAMSDKPTLYYAINVTELDFSDYGKAAAIFCADNPFSGSLDGRGAVIRNADFTSSNGAIGLLGYMIGAKVGNLTLINCKISESQCSYTGLLASYAINCTLTEINIQDCSVRSEGFYTGAVAGYLGGTVNNLSVVADVTSVGGRYAGGIAGVLSGEIVNADYTAKSAGLTSNADFSGGLAGRFDTGTITLSDVAADVTLTGGYGGGLCYEIKGSVSDSTYIGNLKLTNTGNAYVGGIAYSVTGSASGLTVGGSIDVTADNTTVGGVLGIISAANSANGLTSTADITVKAEGTAYIGGVSGKADGAAADFSYRGDLDLQAEDGYFGGVIGDSSANLVGGSAVGTAAISITKSGYFGGVIGRSSATVTELSSDITAETEGKGYYGGLVGYSTGVINDGTVSGGLTACGEDIYAGAVGYAEQLINGLNVGTSAKRYSLRVNVGKTYNSSVGAAAYSDSVTDFTVYADIITGGNGKTGGISAFCGGEVVGCSVDVTATASGALGGAFAVFGGTVSGLRVKAVLSVSGEEALAGGIAAENSGDIDAAVLDGGSVRAEGANATVGGLVGKCNNDIISSAVFEVAVTALGDNVTAGGAVGIGSGNYSVTVRGTVTAEGSISAYVGGISGKNGYLNGGFSGRITADGGLLYAGGLGGYVSTAQGTASVTLNATGGSVFAGLGVGYAENVSNLVLSGCSLNVEGLTSATVGGAAGDADYAENIAVTALTVAASSPLTTVGVIAGSLNYGSFLGVGTATAPLNLTLTDKVNSFGFLCGALAGSIDSSSVNGSAVIDGQYAGAICGTAENSIVTDVTVNVNLSGNGVMGGAVGYGTVTVSGLTIRGKTETSGGFIGGVLGRGVLNGSAASAIDVKATAAGAAAGGLVGATTDEVKGAYSGNLTTSGNGSFAGGIVGRGSIVTDSVFSGSVSVGGTESAVGGIAGLASFVSRCSSQGVIVGAGTVGAIAGDAEAVSLCGVTASMTFKDATAVGGIVGKAKSVTDCYFLGTLTDEGDSVGGLICGKGDDTVIDSVYFAGENGGISKLVGSGTYTARYAYTDSGIKADGAVSLALSAGRTVALSGFGDNWSFSDNAYPFLTQAPLALLSTADVQAEALSVTADDNAELAALLPKVFDKDGILSGVVWSCEDDILTVVNNSFFIHGSGTATLRGRIYGGAEAYTVTATLNGGDSVVGDGTELNPYVIDNEGFTYLLESYHTAHFVITSDLQLNGIDSLCKDGFSGVLLGNGFTIYGLTAPLFTALNGATVDNLVLSSFSVKSVNADIGLLAGSAVNSTVKNLTVIDSLITAEGGAAGGILGFGDNVLIENCRIEYTLNVSGANAGGAIGALKDGEMKNVTANVNARLSGGAKFGGLACDLLLSSINSGYAVTVVKAADGASVGGAAYYADGDSAIELSAAVLTVTGGAAVGGFVYRNEADITDCYSATVADADCAYASFVYENGGSISDCYYLAEGVSVGDGIGISGVTAISLSALKAIPDGFVTSDWNTDGAMPRPTNSGDVIGNAAKVITESISVSGTDVFSLADYLSVEYGVFNQLSVTSSDPQRLALCANGCLKAATPLAFGEVTLTLTAADGKTYVVAVEVSFESDSSFESGCGTEYSPYVITTAEQFGLIYSTVGKFYRLNESLVLSGNTFLGGDFNGVLDGNGNSITLNGGSACLFGSLSGEIRNLRILADQTAVGLIGVSGVLATESENLTLNNVSCDIDVTVSGALSAVGLIGTAEATVIRGGNYKVALAVNTDMTANVGGVFGLAASTSISGAVLDLNVTFKGNGNVGGLLGSGDSQTRIAFVKGATSVTVTDGNVTAGGIGGSLYSAEHCVLTDVNVNVTGETVSVGGIAGECAELKDSSIANVNLTVIAHSGYCGGLAGSADTVADSEVKGVINYEFTSSAVADSYFGGAVGMAASISEIDVETDVTVNVDASDVTVGKQYVFAGGISGYSDSVFDCSFSGDITASAVGNSDNVYLYAGGISGAIGLIVSRGAVQGSITVTGSSSGAVGGIIGLVDVTSASGGSESTEAELKNASVSFCVADVTLGGASGMAVGGIVGSLSQSGENVVYVCYAYAKAAGRNVIGASVGTITLIKAETVDELSSAELPESCVITVNERRLELVGWVLWNVTSGGMPVLK